MEDCRGTCYVFGHVVEDAITNYIRNHIKNLENIDLLKLPVANFSQTVMHNIGPLLRRLGRVSNNVHNGHELSIAAGNGAYVG
jgi:hypothetical protein